MAFLEFDKTLEQLTHQNLIDEMKAAPAGWFGMGGGGKDAKVLLAALDTKMAMGSDEEFRVLTSKILNAESEAIMYEQSKNMGLKVNERALKKVVGDAHSEATTLLKDLTKAEQAISSQRQSLMTAVKTKLESTNGVIQGLQKSIAAGTPITLDIASGAAHEELNKLVTTYGGKPLVAGVVTNEAIADMNQALSAWRADRIDSMTKILEEGSASIGKRKEAVMKSLSTIEAKSGIAYKGAIAAESIAAEVGKDVGKLNGQISKSALEAGLVGEEAHNAKGFFSKLIGNAKANLNIDKVTKNASTGALEITERGAMGKGMRLAGAGAGAILVGYGLKDLAKSVGLSGPDTDEQGREIPADSSTLVKSVAELGAGAALAYFTLLKGGKAVGALAK